MLKYMYFAYKSFGILSPTSTYFFNSLMNLSFTVSTASFSCNFIYSSSFLHTYSGSLKDRAFQSAKILAEISKYARIGSMFLCNLL